MRKERGGRMGEEEEEEGGWRRQGRKKITCGVEKAEDSLGSWDAHFDEIMGDLDARERAHGHELVDTTESWLSLKGRHSEARTAKKVDCRVREESRRGRGGSGMRGEGWSTGKRRVCRTRKRTRAGRGG